MDHATADGTRFLGHEIMATTRFVPDTAALAASTTRVVVSVGASSGGQLAHRTALALAERLGVQAIEFLGGHGGFTLQPQEFADAFGRCSHLTPCDAALIVVDRPDLTSVGDRRC